MEKHTITVTLSTSKIQSLLPKNFENIFYRVTSFFSRLLLPTILLVCPTLPTTIHLFNYNFKVVKVKSLCLIKHHVMKMYWESGGIVPHTFLTLALDGGE
jgi:hypothetical protein